MLISFSVFQTSESCIKLHAVAVLELLLSEQCVCVCVCVCVCPLLQVCVCVCVCVMIRLLYKVRKLLPLMFGGCH